MKKISDEFPSVSEMFGGNATKLAKIAQASTRFTTSLQLWQLWTALSVLSSFVAVWLLFLRVLDWTAVVIVACMLVGGLAARPSLPTYEEEGDDVSDNA